MDYAEIPDEYRKYVKKSSYNKLDEDERRVYLKAIRHASRRFAKEQDEFNSSSEMQRCLEEMRIVPLSTEVSFVGIKYRGGFSFDVDTDVKLERDDDNPEDSNAIKVFIKKNNIWKHVAYVAKDDAIELRKYGRFEEKRLKFLRQYQTSARYRIFIGA